jgi:hypothetical protein
MLAEHSSLQYGCLSEESKKDSGLAACFAALAPLAGSLALVAFFPDWALVRATWALRGAGLAFLVASGVATAVAWAASLSVVDVVMSILLPLDYRGHDMDHSGRAQRQVKSAAGAKGLGGYD